MRLPFLFQKNVRIPAEGAGRFIVNVIEYFVNYSAQFLSAVYYLFGLDMKNRADSHEVILLKLSGTVDEAGKASSESGLVDESADTDAVFFKVVSYSFFNHFLCLPFVACLCPCPYREV